MAVKILWSPAVCPEERKRYQWEHIIRFEMGEESADLVVSLRLEQARSRWQVETPVPASRERIVRALRAAGKPVV
jgi:hypothetical protein